MAKNDRTHDETAHLVSMASDIAANLSFHADSEDRIVDHLRRFWAPRMRALILEYADTDGDDLSEAMSAALVKLRAITLKEPRHSVQGSAMHDANPGAILGAN